MEPNQTFIIIPDSIQRDERIDWPHRAIWGIIHAFSRNGGECWLSVEQIGERIHRKRRQTSSMIQDLLNFELIEIASWDGRKRSLRTTEISTKSDARNPAHVQPAAHQVSGKPHISHAEFRTSAMRKTAHKEYKIEENIEENQSTGEKKLEVMKTTSSAQPSKPKKSGPKSSGQKPSSMDECREYFVELNSDDWMNFWDYWSSVGWNRRTGKILCWKSTARIWVRKNKSHGTIDKNKPFNPTDAISWANQ